MKKSNFSTEPTQTSKKKNDNQEKNYFRENNFASLSTLSSVIDREG